MSRDQERSREVEFMQSGFILSPYPQDFGGMIGMSVECLREKDYARYQRYPLCLDKLSLLSSPSRPRLTHTRQNRMHSYWNVTDRYKEEKHLSLLVVHFSLSCSQEFEAC